MKKILAILLFGFVAHMWAMEQSEQPFSHNTYNKLIINACSILDLAPQMPQEKGITKTETWIAQHATNIKQWTETPELTSLSQVCTRHYLNQLDAIKPLGYTNYSTGSNLSLDTGDNTIVKISSLTNRLYTLHKLATGKDPYWDTELKKGIHFSEFPFEQMTASGIPTFQHISILAHYLRLKEVIEQKKLKHIKAVPSYPWHIPGQPLNTADSNYVVVQPKYGEHIQEIRNLTQEKQIAIINNLSPETLSELHQAIEYAALWDVRNNLMVNTNDTNELWYADFEQPNNSGEFFYKGAKGLEKYKHDVSVGLKEMGEKLKKISVNKFEQWQALGKK